MKFYIQLIKYNVCTYITSGYALYVCCVKTTLVSHFRSTYVQDLPKEELPKEELLKEGLQDLQRSTYYIGRYKTYKDLLVSRPTMYKTY
jgi:hypothetical protein